MHELNSMRLSKSNWYQYDIWCFLLILNIQLFNILKNLMNIMLFPIYLLPSLLSCKTSLPSNHVLMFHKTLLLPRKPTLSGLSFLLLHLRNTWPYHKTSMSHQFDSFIVYPIFFIYLLFFLWTETFSHSAVLPTVFFCKSLFLIVTSKSSRLYGCFYFSWRMNWRPCPTGMPEWSYLWKCRPKVYTARDSRDSVFTLPSTGY